MQRHPPNVGDRSLRIVLVLFVLFFIVPILVSASLYYFNNDIADWRSADRSSVGLLLPAEQNEHAVVRIFSAPTVSWRGIVATHSWIVLKDKGASAYRRFDYTAWGEPIWVDRFVPDGRWFGRRPDVVYAADGEDAERIIPAMREAIANYRYNKTGDYRVWPGPNSNTFVAAIMAAVPGIATALPPTAIGKDFPLDGKWFAPTASGTGFRFNAGGYVGVSLAWVEGFEINILGAVAGLDFRRPALKIPSFGRIGR
jgi:hypothetical protein